MIFGSVYFLQYLTLTSNFYQFFCLQYMNEPMVNRIWTWLSTRHKWRDNPMVKLTVSIFRFRSVTITQLRYRLPPHSWSSKQSVSSLSIFPCEFFGLSLFSPPSHMIPAKSHWSPSWTFNYCPFPPCLCFASSGKRQKASFPREFFRGTSLPFTYNMAHAV